VQWIVHYFEQTIALEARLALGNLEHLPDIFHEWDSISSDCTIGDSPEWPFPQIMCKIVFPLSSRRSSKHPGPNLFTNSWTSSRSPYRQDSRSSSFSSSDGAGDIAETRKWRWRSLVSISISFAIRVVQVWLNIFWKHNVLYLYCIRIYYIIFWIRLNMWAAITVAWKVPRGFLQPPRLLYHFDRPFSHASRATVNWTLEVFHHGSQAAVNTW